MAPMEGGNSGQGLSQYASGGLNQYGEPISNSTAYQGEALTLVPICIFLVVVRMTGPVTTLGVCPTGSMTNLLCVSNIRLTPLIGYFFFLFSTPFLSPSPYSSASSLAAIVGVLPSHPMHRSSAHSDLSRLMQQDRENEIQRAQVRMQKRVERLRES